MYIKADTRLRGTICELIQPDVAGNCGAWGRPAQLQQSHGHEASAVVARLGTPSAPLSHEFKDASMLKKESPPLSFRLKRCLQVAPLPA